MVSGYDLFKDEKKVVGVSIDNDLFDLSTKLTDEQVNQAEKVLIDSQDGLHILRHSTAHVLAQAIQNLYPDAKLGIGPVIENGFYYDFANVEPFTPEDLQVIEKEMLKIVNKNQKFQRVNISKDEARTLFKNEPFKLELIENRDNLSIYNNVDGEDVIWKDLCMGPHLPNTKLISNNFKLTRTSAAYWLGNENNPSMQRIYGTVFADKQSLNEYLHFLEEVKKRDHRKLGTTLDLFSFPKELGAGLSVFHPKGGLIRSIMEDYSRKKHLEAGYDFVYTPHISKSKLYEISGHLDWYKDGMYPPMSIEDDQSDYYLKPMNCPMHILIYKSSSKSYRQLPIRLFEFGTVYRFEKSGVIHGLTRDRCFTQDDAHIFCEIDQIETELKKLLKFVLDLLKDYGLNDFYLEISTKNPKKFVGTDEIWETATNTLVNVATQSGLDLVLDEYGAAFYGPKISVQIKDALGRSWQLSTIQLDFNLPQRFNLTYQSKSGTLEQPVMIHRALFGSIERFFAILTEHYSGRFPAWLSATQVVCVPVSQEHIEYIENVKSQLVKNGIRAEIDYSDDRFAKKIRNAIGTKSPFILIAGDADIEKSAVSLRYEGGQQENTIPLETAIDKIKTAIKPPN